MNSLSYIVISNCEGGRDAFCVMMDMYGRERAEVLAEYVIETGATVRACAQKFGISKSTVHKDLSFKLRYINKNLYMKVKKILDINKAERHIRGGEATKKKYIEKSKKGSTLH